MKEIIGSAVKNNCHKKSKKFCRLILLLIVYPYLVGFSPDPADSSGTVIDLLLGFGRHSNVSYDCAGNAIRQTDYSTLDYGITVSHNIDAFKFGGRAGGYIINKTNEASSDYNLSFYESAASNNNSVFYLNPFLGAETKYFEFSAGVSVFSESSQPGVNELAGNISKYLISDGNIHPSWILRIGNREKFHFSTQYLSNVPLFSGGGMFDMGFGFGSTENRNLTWVGMSEGPYQNAGLSIKQNVQLTDKIDLLIRGRIGMIEETFEGGISAGMRINL